MRNKYSLKIVLFNFKSFADSHNVFVSTTGGDLLRKPMNQSLNGVAKFHKPMLGTFQVEYSGDRARRTVKSSD